jgi:hypothetical protein
MRKRAREGHTSYAYYGNKRERERERERERYASYMCAQSLPLSSKFLTFRDYLSQCSINFDRIHT